MNHPELLLRYVVCDYNRARIRLCLVLFSIILFSYIVVLKMGKNQLTLMKCRDITYRQHTVIFMLSAFMMPLFNWDGTFCAMIYLALWLFKYSMSIRYMKTRLLKVFLWSAVDSVGCPRSFRIMLCAMKHCAMNAWYSTGIMYSPIMSLAVTLVFSMWPGTAAALKRGRRASAFNNPFQHVVSPIFPGSGEESKNSSRSFCRGLNAKKFLHISLELVLQGTAHFTVNQK